MIKAQEQQMGLQQLAAGNEKASSAEYTGPDTLLYGRWLLLARCTTAVLSALLLIFFITSLPVYFTQLQTTCVSAPCPHWQLTPANVKAIQHAGLSINLYAIFNLALSLFSALVWFAVAAFIVWRRSNDWLALLTALFLVTIEVLQYSGGPSPPLDYRSPFSHVIIISLFLLFTILYLLVFSLFPNGRFVPRWMPWFVIAQFVLGAIALCLPSSFSTTGIVFTPLTTTLLISAWVIIIGGQVYRYRRVSSPAERQQTKWIVLGLIVGPVIGSLYYFSPMVFPSLSGPGSLYFLLLNPVFTIATLFSPFCFGIALLRYRLWDVDVIINRTLVYGTLTISIVVLYSLIVVGLGALLQTTGNLLISLLATALVAILFQPLRERLQRGVNHLLYGERDTPYQVISRLGKRLEVTLAPDEMLPTIVETVAQALKLPYVAITLKQEREFAEVASYGAPRDELTCLPLLYQNEQVGELLLAPRASGETFTPADRTLLNDLARQIGVAAHVVRLTTDLQRSRERLVTAREEERRRLRRDLHDGLGPALATITVKAEAARDAIEAEPAQAITLLEDLISQAQAAITDIRRLVYNLRPPALDDLGLVTAIRTQAMHYEQSGLRISVEAPESLPELPAAVEVATYRIMQEALTNVVRHANARSCLIRLVFDGMLHLEVRDDGCGISPHRQAGVGLRSMQERAVEVGGHCVVEALPGRGTRVQADLPCSSNGRSSIL
jgi:signal transduction histidine kinase